MARASAGFSRFLTLSLVVHTAVIAAGLTAGAVYRRASGAEAPPSLIVFDSTPEPRTTDSLVTASAEPESAIEKPEPPADPEPSLDASLTETPEPPVSESFASAATASLPSASTSLEELIGDPRASWRLPSLEHSGLQLDLASQPQVSECCQEPQPVPATPTSVETYVYPEVVKMARAEFPRLSQRLGEHGSVLLEMTVGADGLVKEVKVAESSGFARIDDCAVAAAWDWIFKPATRNGVAEAAIARHRYTFRLT